MAKKIWSEWRTGKTKVKSSALYPYMWHNNATKLSQIAKLMAIMENRWKPKHLTMNHFFSVFANTSHLSYVYSSFLGGLMPRVCNVTQWETEVEEKKMKWDRKLMRQLLWYTLKMLKISHFIFKPTQEGLHRYLNRVNKSLLYRPAKGYFVH